jgi:hypothetical protein
MAPKSAWQDEGLSSGHIEGQLLLNVEAIAVCDGWERHEDTGEHEHLRSPCPDGAVETHAKVRLKMPG